MPDLPMDGVLPDSYGCEKEIWSWLTEPNFDTLSIPVAQRLVLRALEQAGSDIQAQCRSGPRSAMPPWGERLDVAFEDFWNRLSQLKTRVPCDPVLFTDSAVTLFHSLYELWGLMVAMQDGIPGEKDWSQYER